MDTTKNASACNNAPVTPALFHKLLIITANSIYTHITRNSFYAHGHMTQPKQYFLPRAHWKKTACQTAPEICKLTAWWWQSIMCTPANDKQKQTTPKCIKISFYQGLTHTDICENASQHLVMKQYMKKRVLKQCSYNCLHYDLLY